MKVITNFLMRAGEIYPVIRILGLMYGILQTEFYWFFEYDDVKKDGERREATGNHIWEIAIPFAILLR